MPTATLTQLEESVPTLQPESQLRPQAQTRTSTPPPNPPYITQTAVAHEPTIRIKDKGTTYTLGYEMYKYWSEMETFLREHLGYNPRDFKHGLFSTAKKEIRDDGGKVVRPDEWERTVRPDWSGVIGEVRKG